MDIISPEISITFIRTSYEMIYKKVVSFDLDKTIERRPIKELYLSFEKIKSSGDTTLTEEFIVDVIAYGFPFTKNMLHRAMVDPGKLAAFGCFLKDLSSLAKQIGIKMVRLAPGKFIYQRLNDTDFAGCELAETPFTNGQFKKLLELEPEKVAKIINNPQDRLAKSLAISIEKTDEGKANSPMVFLSHTEATALASLLGLRLPTEKEWERAAAGTDGKKYPDNIMPIDDNDNRIVAVIGSGGGTSDVTKLRKTGEGFLGLIGTVWQWMSDYHSQTYQLFKFYQRGGSWHDDNEGYLRSNYHCFDNADGRSNSVGVRFAKDLPT
ncbi:hypothetical protein A2230_05665 [candidate division WOR-1 bacterium RIFOXYA2_FULL_36_21]|uniref:Sulfatase-modifying factor enzyme-like domain-containing protein n=1 Tax=candidate division WOR-1 bacterium RIFOXYB2_FULL_36_35 TaxID=1802578 RepID=A0A1F4S533_UNCSA|nr:MAG: hypothetical protein A2230_05665 [candidate division WOR-1 bacterium RIFOXYA2_FULL_36_21]OGC15542.1 MAG: hypothetical protein A2290_04060 [candidate division WOR-1 bacterium RIFOXYB2_FULL_36_35]